MARSSAEFMKLIVSERKPEHEIALVLVGAEQRRRSDRGNFRSPSACSGTRGDPMSHPSFELAAAAERRADVVVLVELGGRPYIDVDAAAVFGSGLHPRCAGSSLRNRRTAARARAKWPTFPAPGIPRSSRRFACLWDFPDLRTGCIRIPAADRAHRPQWKTETEDSTAPWVPPDSGEYS